MTKTKALLVVLAIAIASAGWADWRVFVIGGQVAVNQQHDTRALCSFRADLQKRADAGRDFLKTHPHGILGIPAATLRVSINNERHTLAALRPLVC